MTRKENAIGREVYDERNMVTRRSCVTRVHAWLRFAMDFLDARASRDYFATSLGTKEAHGVTMTALDLFNTETLTRSE
jgi:hypothetical protein